MDFKNFSYHALSNSSGSEGGGGDLKGSISVQNVLHWLNEEKQDDFDDKLASGSVLLDITVEIIRSAFG